MFAYLIFKTKDLGERNFGVLHYTPLIVLIATAFGGFPQWGAADAEIKVPSVENTELEGSPFKAWGRSIYSHACYAYSQECLLC